MYESIALTFEAILNPDDHKSLYDKTSDDSDETEIDNFKLDSDTRTKAQRLCKLWYILSVLSFLLHTLQVHQWGSSLA